MTAIHNSLAAALFVAFANAQVRSEELAVQTINLPPLRIQGQAARAHTQGLEVAGGKYFVTARREDIRPKQALLLRTSLAGAGWEVWDITPAEAQGATTTCDHPGGMQSDGTRLWIPVAESRRGGRCIIRAFQLSEIVPGRRLKADVEFPVDDHIGAVAVSDRDQLLFGANWDTEKIYVWDLQGRLRRTLTGTGLVERGLGPVAGPEGRPGVAVQDWKFHDEQLFASGLFRTGGTPVVSPASRLISFTNFLERDCQQVTVALPRRDGLELAREAMAILDGAIYFLPEDLSVSNRMFRVSLADLLKQTSAR